LILAVASSQWPLLFRLAEHSKGRVSPVMLDASKLWGGSDRGENPLGFVPIRALILVLTIAATSLPIALVITPFSERRPLSPSVLLSIVREGTLEPRIALGIVLILVGRLSAFAMASRTRSGSLGDWFRG
jgi:hypothetical protein